MSVITLFCTAGWSDCPARKVPAGVTGCEASLTGVVVLGVTVVFAAVFDSMAIV